MADLDRIDPDRTYSIGQAAGLSGLSRDVLISRCNAGVLPCLRPAGVRMAHRRVTGADLIAFLRASGVPATAAPPAAAPAPAPPPPSATGVRRKARADHLRALREIGCG